MDPSLQKPPSGDPLWLDAQVRNLSLSNGNSLCHTLLAASTLSPTTLQLRSAHTPLHNRNIPPLPILQQVSPSHSSINSTKLIPQQPTRRQHLAFKEPSSWQVSYKNERKEHAPSGGLH